jgi:hypothetical protein
VRCKATCAATNEGLVADTGAWKQRPGAAGILGVLWIEIAEGSQEYLYSDLRDLTDLGIFKLDLSCTWV